MRFKVGDKVQIVKSPGDCWDRKGLCEVIATCEDSGFVCRIKEISTSWNCLMFADEIEKVSIKGQQLVFDFALEL